MAKHHTKKDKLNFLEIYRGLDGHISKACDKFGITRRTFYDWKKDDWFEQAIDDIDEEELDDAEEMSRLMRKGVPEYQRDKKGAIVNDDKGKPIITGWLIPPSPKMVQFYLERKGVERGYGKIQTLKHELDNMPDEVNIGLTVHKKKKDK